MPNKPRNAKIEAGKKIRSGNARPRGRQKHGHDLRERADVSADLVCDAAGSDDFPVKVGADIVFLGSIRPGFSKSTYEGVKKKHQAKREFKVGGKNFRFYQCAKSGCGVWVTEKSNLPNLKKHGLPQKSGFKFSDETHAELQHRSCWMKHLSKRRKRDADIDGRTLLYYSKADAKDAHDDEKNLTIWCQKCNGPDGQRAVRDNAAKEAVKPEWDF